MGAKVSTEIQCFTSWDRPLVHCVFTRALGNDDFLLVRKEHVVCDLLAEEVHNVFSCVEHLMVKDVHVFLGIFHSDSKIRNVVLISLNTIQSIRHFELESTEINFKVFHVAYDITKSQIWLRHNCWLFY